MKVLFLTYYTCIRAIKEMIALQKAGVNVFLLQTGNKNIEFNTMFGWTMFYNAYEPDTLRYQLSRITGVDVIHCHNEPSWIVSIAKECCPDIPVIFDTHDLFTARDGKPNQDERQAFQDCDAVVTPSKGYKQHIIDFYGLQKPIEVIYSYCNENFYFDRYRDKNPQQFPGIVYEGGITNKPDSYRYYVDVVRNSISRGIPFNIYPVDTGISKIYQDAGANVMAEMSYFDLIPAMSRFEWGFVGPGFKHRAFDWAMPNKLFEYLAAGIPPVVYESQEALEFVKEHGIGIEFKDDAIKDKDVREMYAGIVKEKRFIMESQSSKLIALYESLANEKI